MRQAHRWLTDPDFHPRALSARREAADRLMAEIRAEFDRDRSKHLRIEIDMLDRMGSVDWARRHSLELSGPEGGRTDGPTLKGFIAARVQREAMVYTDDHPGYQGLPNHGAVRHGVGEYVREQAHTNGIESFWSLLKRGYYGTYHHWSAKHLSRYVDEFTGRHNARPLDTVAQMQAIVRGMSGKRLRYVDLVA